MATRIQLRRDTAENWTNNNPTLAEGEIGFETDTGLFKIGANNTAWTSLAYAQVAGPMGNPGDDGPQGPQGEPGQQGEPGENGSDGDNGLNGEDGTDGLSAYEIWLNLGNSGTEQDFVDSLAGEDGPMGPAGSDGTNGTNGTNGQGVVAGGTAGQVLAKIDATDYNTQWVNQSGGGDSSVPPAYVPFVSGGFYKSPGANGNGFVANQNSTYFGHFYVGATTSFDRIGCTAGTLTSSGNARLGIYTDSGGKPGTLVLDAGTVAYSTTNTAYLITIDQSLTPGWYWLAFNAQSGTSQWFGSGGNQTSIQGVQRMGSTNAFTSMISGYEQSSVTGAFPASASAAFTTSNGIPSAYLRAT
jgi:hypothetical protein